MYTLHTPHPNLSSLHTLVTVSARAATQHRCSGLYIGCIEAAARAAAAAAFRERHNANTFDVFDDIGAALSAVYNY
jgi:hypothetical protein